MSPLGPPAPGDAFLPPARWPVDPGPSHWVFDASAVPAGEDFLGVGADLEPATLLAAYRSGVFPMPTGPGRGRRSPGRRPRIGWWSPDPRGVIPLDGLRVSRSLRAACRRFTVRVDTAYDAVVEGCAHPPRHGSWISPEMVAAYRRLHDLGWVHSVESWRVAADGTEHLAGGLYGVAIGGLFAGESMYHGPDREDRDASKVALVGLVERLRSDSAPRVLDVQWATPHLVSLGAVEVPRPTYLRMVRDAVELPPPRLSGPGT